MDRNFLEETYIKHGLEDFRLKTVEDILKCHWNDVTGVSGYDLLTEEQRAIYHNFIVNFYNGHGLTRRTKIEPTGIYFVEDYEELCDDINNENCVTQKSRVITYKDENGKDIILKEYADEEYKDRKVVEKTINKYLRFEFLDYDLEGWLHITEGGNEWY